MRKYRIWLSSIALAALVLALLPAVTLAQPSERKIVVFEGDVLNEGARAALVEKFGGVEVRNLKSANGKAVILPPRAASALAKIKGVKRVDDDVVVSALGRADVSGKGSKPTPVQPPQTLPWGVERIDAELVWGATTGAGVKVAVVDTGIDLTHPDLAVNIKGGYNAISPLKSANDDNGHGTHVAGIIAAANNAIGVVGVGPQIDLYAVKVLDRRGSGYLSDIIEGLDWAAQNGIQVVNMSLGTSSNVLSFHEAVQRTKAAGVTLVAAAGNSGGSVGYPAAYPEVIAVSATDNTNAITSWSSRGPEVDLAAPGKSIYSTYKGLSYATLSGTSMASPHVAGAAALVLTQTEKCDADLSGACSPDEVQARLELTATELGAAGKDSLYGSGLVNASAAVTQ